MFEEWLGAFAKDTSSNHKDFFRTFLKANYEDYREYRAVADTGAGSKKAKKKAKKLKRHISLNVHQDKLPTYCNTEDIRDMMASVMAHLEDVEKCIESPHTCNPGDL